MGCKEREIEHFESLFYELYPRLCALADHYLNDEEQSKDIVQEAFLNLWSMKETGKNIFFKSLDGSLSIYFCT